MTTLWLTRHAESADPTVFHGAESNIGLSALGARQTAAAAEWFKQLGPRAVVSSAMIRARETAAPIAAACGVPHVIEPELYERRVGDLSGTRFSSHGGPWHDTIHRWMAGDTSYTTPGAESFDALIARLVPALERVEKRFPDGRTVVVAHGVVCKALLLSLLPGWSVADWQKLGKVSNLAVSELRFDGSVWTAGTLLEVPPPVAALASTSGAGEKSQG